jgi:sRNA-binding regulator protein Hfq
MKKPEDFEYKGIIYLTNGAKVTVYLSDASEFQKLMNDEKTQMIFFTSFDDKNREKTLGINKNFITSITIFENIPIIEE